MRPARTRRHRPAQVEFFIFVTFLSTARQLRCRTSVSILIPHNATQYAADRSMLLHGAYAVQNTQSRPNRCRDKFPQHNFETEVHSSADHEPHPALMPSAFCERI